MATSDAGLATSLNGSTNPTASQPRADDDANVETEPAKADSTTTDPTRAEASPAASDAGGDAADDVHAAKGAETATDVFANAEHEALDSSRDSAVPLDVSDFLEELPARQRSLPKAPARLQRPKPDREWVDDLPISVGTPTLSALVQRAAPESESPPANSTQRDVLLDRSFQLPGSLPGGDWDSPMMPLLRKPDTDAPVVSPSVAPASGIKPSSIAVLLAVVAGGAFAAGMAVRRPAPPVLGEAAVARSEVTPNIQAARPVVTPPEFATEPLAPEQSPEALPLAEAAVASAEAAPPPAPLPTSEPGAARASEPAPSAASGSAHDSVQDQAPAVAPDNGEAKARQVIATKASKAEAAGPDFDAQAAETAISAAAIQAASCKRPDDPSGVAVVTITFSPSGRATTANVSGLPFAGTATGGCIAAAMRGARVPAFGGDFLTVRKSVKLE